MEGPIFLPFIKEEWISIRSIVSQKGPALETQREGFTFILIMVH